MNQKFSTDKKYKKILEFVRNGGDAQVPWQMVVSNVVVRSITNLIKDLCWQHVRHLTTTIVQYTCNIPDCVITTYKGEVLYSRPRGFA